ncbi:hypothetical protein M409DRAFT_27539 [Zasmidium cellare ATCC 36951]|uniref:Uncharacterized protein n=1 Tax=Zasmidium cellare ATCC 36951 TaxID=1080233 RepID=A0A6A6C9M6_ZASCE|nr:uncharacterized protein M409DRAFT_27539 [Zasmidium cellare ATCC 36951]KAF2162156.1 hypothetical protein M409DRAFT_27539 [Zasmidium cellare ATCC 36951]
MSEPKKESKDETKALPTSKAAEAKTPPSTKQASPKDNPTTQQQSKVPAQQRTSEATTTREQGQPEYVDLADAPAPFEDVDLSDPPPDEPSFEMVEHRDAPHSSYNSHQDHKWKYPEGFGKGEKKGGGDNKEAK